MIPHPEDCSKRTNAARGQLPAVVLLSDSSAGLLRSPDRAHVAVGTGRAGSFERPRPGACTGLSVSDREPSRLGSSLHIWDWHPSGAWHPPRRPIEHHSVVLRRLSDICCGHRDCGATASSLQDFLAFEAFGSQPEKICEQNQDLSRKSHSTQQTQHRGPAPSILRGGWLPAATARLLMGHQTCWGASKSRPCPPMVLALVWSRPEARPGAGAEALPRHAADTHVAWQQAARRTLLCSFGPCVWRLLGKTLQYNM